MFVKSIIIILTVNKNYSKILNNLIYRNGLPFKDHGSKYVVRKCFSQLCNADDLDQCPAKYIVRTCLKNNKVWVVQEEQHRFIVNFDEINIEDGLSSSSIETKTHGLNPIVLKIIEEYWGGFVASKYRRLNRWHVELQTEESNQAEADQKINKEI